MERDPVCQCEHFRSYHARAECWFELYVDGPYCSCSGFVAQEAAAPSQAGGRGDRDMSARQYGYAAVAGRAHILRATYGDTSRALCGTILQRLETDSHPALPDICRRCRSIEAKAISQSGK